MLLADFVGVLFLPNLWMQIHQKDKVLRFADSKTSQGTFLVSHTVVCELWWLSKFVFWLICSRQLAYLTHCQSWPWIMWLSVSSYLGCFTLVHLFHPLWTASLIALRGGGTVTIFSFFSMSSMIAGKHATQVCKGGCRCGRWCILERLYTTQVNFDFFIICLNEMMIVVIDL